MIRGVARRGIRGGRGAGSKEPSSSRALSDITKLRARWVGGQIAVSLLEGVFEAAILTLFARLALQAVDSDAPVVAVPGLGNRPLTFGIGVLVALIFGRLISGLLNTFIANRLQLSLVRDIRHKVLTVYSESSWSSQVDLDDGALQQLVVTLPSGISSQLAGLISNAGHITMMIAMLGYSMFTDARLTAALMAVIALATFGFRPLRFFIKRVASRTLVHQRALSGGVSELTGLRFEAQALGLGEALSYPLHKVVDDEANQAERLGQLKGSVVPLFTSVTYLAVTLAILILVNTESGNLAKTGPILLVVLRSLSYGTAIQQAAAGLASLRPSISLLSERLADLEDRRITWGNEPFRQFEAIRFQKVSFTYPSANDPALRDASFEISRGMRVGLVGPSGGGKTTTARLLLGLIEPDSGCVSVNGKPLQLYKRESWTRQVGVVAQSAQLLHGTISDNLRLHRANISDQDLWDALEIADFAQEVRSFPAGLETVIGAGKRALSGGQMQRLTIARAFANRPDFVVMDEPTSSIDALSESAVSDAIAKIPTDVTLVIISHRMRILHDCDLLVVVENGRISAAGTPREVATESIYLRSLAGSAGFGPAV